MPSATLVTHDLEETQPDALVNQEWRLRNIIGQKILSGEGAIQGGLVAGMDARI
jgi:hypothetical protein